VESPEGWDALTASLAVVSLDQADTAWAFIVTQGLVSDGPEDRLTFLRLLKEEMEREPITGPSIALRLADAMRRGGMTRPAAHLPDPWARKSKVLLASNPCYRTKRP